MELHLFHVGTENVVEEEEGRGVARITLIADLSEEEYVAFVTKKKQHKLVLTI